MNLNFFLMKHKIINIYFRCSYLTLRQFNELEYEYFILNGLNK